MEFVTNYNEILTQINAINPIKYAQTRNFIDGAVTGLSPYISRGVINTSQIKKNVLAKYKPYKIQKFLQELAWREYWQRVWQHKGALIFTDIKQQQQNVRHFKTPTAIVSAATGINAVDAAIQSLYSSGYMHNHLRMYVSSIACNVAGAHWLQPSQWMYYHLLDGDLASNILSWQWVAGTNASKKYYCNQENINRYTYNHQQNTFLDTTYENIESMFMPDVLQPTIDVMLQTGLPHTALPVLNQSQPLCIYNSYNLDPLWHADENCNRILLLEPSHFKKFPVGENVLNFIIALAKNISNVQVYAGEFNELQNLYTGSSIYFKQHPAFLHYKGTAEAHEWMYPEVNGYYPSFSAYWKKCERFLK